VSSQTRVCVIIVAAGSSARLGTDKMFVKLGSSPLLAHTVAVFEECPAVDEIVLVLSEANLEQGRALAQTQRWTKLRHLCLGGPRRQDSVVAGLHCLGACHTVMVHDGARPLLTRAIVEAGLAAVQVTGAAIAAVAVKDTIKEVDARGFVRATMNRTTLRAVQTPQVFDYDLLLRAYAQAQDGEYTDDAAVVEAMGHPVVVYPGSYDNIKVTTWEDVEFAEAIVRRRSGDA
jgi:2-C-methyl-D-erythritol 4-phosphate cytidylyltransferase